MKKYSEEEICENMERCRNFKKCSMNLCPLDFHLFKRVGQEQDKCRWMREKRGKPRKVRFSDAAVVNFASTGGSVMPDYLLKFVPKSNFKWLNELSQKKWIEIKK